MKKRTDGRVIALVALFIGVISLSIGFASISTILNIRGSGTVGSSSWDIHFENLSAADRSSSTVIENTAPAIDPTNKTTIGDYSVTLQTPGDSISYTFDVVNIGSYDAKISELTVPEPTCTGTGTTATADAKNVCDYLTYTLTYEGGTAVQTNDDLAKTNGRKKMVLTLTYDENNEVTASLLPKNDVSISNLDIQIKYVQK